MAGRLTLLVALLAVVASACGAADETTEAAVAVVEEVGAGDQDLAVDDAVDPTTTTTTEAPEPLPTGREAILANQAEGTPYVLWFWGAN